MIVFLPWSKVPIVYVFVCLPFPVLVSIACVSIEIYTKWIIHCVWHCTLESNTETHVKNGFKRIKLM